jgi:DNA-binding MarR family transcriptional regulator
MKKKTTAQQILNILNTQGGKKPKQLVASIKATPASVYTAISKLRSVGLIAKEDDGVYISQTQKSVSKVTNKKREEPAMRMPLYNDKYAKSLEVQVHELEKFCDQWRQNYKKLEADYTQAKIMYLDSQAVVKYLEEKVAQLIKG